MDDDEVVIIPPEEIEKIPGDFDEKETKRQPNDPTKEKVDSEFPPIKEVIREG